MEDYEQYDLSDNDPYLIPDSTCLKNLLGFTSTRELNAAEEVFAKAALAELARNPIQGNFDLSHLQQIHRYIFQDVYEWAGQIRTVEISKGGSLFLPYRLIEDEARAVFKALHDENLLRGLSPREFGARAGFYLGWINKTHPFREGNGRAQRVLLDQLAFLSNYVIEWSAISQEAMGLACREARTVDINAVKLSKLISINVLKYE